MGSIHDGVRKTLLKFLDFLYPAFKRLMTLQMFRYASCGAINAFLNIYLYYLIYNYVIEKPVVQFYSIMITRHVFAYLITFCLAFPVGFYLSMYVVFQESYLRRRTQLVRYFIVTIACVLLNYVLLKFFVEKLGWDPTLSITINICFVVLLSYICQKYFAFRATDRRLKVKDPII